MSEVVLDKFQPRWYQAKIMRAIEEHGYRRVLAVLGRRSGKDVCAFNLLLRQACRKPGSYFYMLPSSAQAKRVIWDAVLGDGTRFLDFIPRDLVDSKNQQEMKVWLKNGSLIQCLGSDNYDRIVGTNPMACVFSEWARADPEAFSYIRPALVANDGWAIFISTPLGIDNHLYDMYKVATQDPNWYVIHLSVDDTKHISSKEIERERAEGLMSYDLILQEYYTHFIREGMEGVYYAHYIKNMRNNDQLTRVPHDPSYLVHTAWDLGMHDNTSIIFFQALKSGAVHVIETYENNNVGLEHYIRVINSRPYAYGKHIAPPDVAVREYTSGVSRIEKARQLGISFTVAPNMRLPDGIEAVRSLLPRLYIDTTNAADLITVLENYRQEFNSKTGEYKPYPRHDRYSHMADALRYAAVSLSRLKPGMTKEDVKRVERERFRRMGYHVGDDLPYPFKNKGR